MNEIEKLEYRFQLMLMYKLAYYAKRRLFNVASLMVGDFGRKFFESRAMKFATESAIKDIKENGYPDKNPFSEVFEFTYTLYYTPDGGATERAVESALYREVANQIEFYNAIRWQTGESVVCYGVHDGMYDLIQEKYGINHSNGVKQKMEEYANAHI